MSFIITALISLFLVLQPGNAAAANSDLTAREFFQDLPCSIFESTVEGLSAPERDTLLRQGFSENWEISGEDKDLLVFSSIPFSDTIVALRLFYNDKDDSVIGIIGTVGAPICVLEAWKRDKNGRTTLADLPDEPDAREFLARGEKLPAGIQPSVTLCLGLNGPPKKQNRRLRQGSRPFLCLQMAAALQQSSCQLSALSNPQACAQVLQGRSAVTRTYRRSHADGWPRTE